MYPTSSQTESTGHSSTTAKFSTRIRLNLVGFQTFARRARTRVHCKTKFSMRGSGDGQSPDSHRIFRGYCTSKYTLNVSQIRPFIENWESFRKFCHGGCTWNSILRTTTVTDFWFFEKKYFHSKIPYVFRWTSWVNITGAQSKSSKILENPESWDWKSP